MSLFVCVDHQVEIFIGKRNQFGACTFEDGFQQIERSYYARKLVVSIYRKHIREENYAVSSEHLVRCD